MFNRTRAKNDLIKKFECPNPGNWLATAADRRRRRRLLLFSRRFDDQNAVSAEGGRQLVEVDALRDVVHLLEVVGR